LGLGVSEEKDYSCFFKDTVDNVLGNVIGPVAVSCFRTSAHLDADERFAVRLNQSDRFGIPLNKLRYPSPIFAFQGKCSVLKLS
jgi:hypothetical protein